MKTSSAVAVVVALVVIVGAVWWIMAQPATSAAPAVTPTDQTGQKSLVLPPTTGNTVTVLYGPNGFSPSTVTIHAGDTVTFTAAAGADEMWVASDPHPTHTGYDGTSRATHCAAGYSGPAPFDQCSSGPSFSFTFNQVGTWGYHNHGNHADTGTVVVQ